MKKPGMGKYVMSSWVTRICEMPKDEARSIAEQEIALNTKLLADQPERARLWRNYIQQANEVLAHIGA